MSHQLTITIHPGRYAICRLDPEAAVPAWARGTDFMSVTRTARELSVVCAQDIMPESAHAQRDHRLLQIEGTLAFELVGILASITAPLAAVNIGVFALSTYETDYMLIAEKDLIRAAEVLEKTGHTIRQKI